MTRARLLAFLLIPLLAGCDIAVGVYFATRNKSSSRRAAVAPSPDTLFSIWVANLAGGGLTDAQVQSNIIGNGGQPTAEWTQVGGFTRTTEVNLALQLPGTWDAILISAGSSQKYLLDAVVILNGSGDPLASFSAAALDDAMLNPANARNLPNGVTSETNATPTQKSFIFQRFSGPIAPLFRFRVEIWDLTIGPTSGDTAWRNTLINAGGDERSGGLGVFVTSPVDQLYVSARAVGATQDVVQVYRLGPNGVPSGPIVPMDVNVPQVGAPALCVTTNGDVVVAHSVSGGDLRVRRFNGALSSTIWNQPIANPGGTAARVEPNSLALDASDNAILAGGLDFGGLTGFGHFMQRFRASDGATWVSPPGPPGDLANSYWRGVVTSGADDIFATGDLNGSLPSTSLDTMTRKTSQSSTGAETWRSTLNGADNLVDCGNAVGVGTGGNVYVGGFVGTSGVGAREAILHKLDNATGASAAAPWPFVFSGSGNGDDEILSLVVEGNLVYATGYETTASQGRNLFVLKLDVSGNPIVLWKRTFHAGVGDDRGVSIRTTPTHVFVSGDVNVGAGDFDIFVWKLLK